jgi:hypothetical protein
MKTQEFKNNESVRTANFIFLILMIIFCQILLSGNKSGELNKTSKELSGPEFEIPAQQICFAVTVAQELEKDKLNLKIKFNNEAINHEIERINNRASAVEFSMAKMNEYLIAAEEPEMNINVAKSIIFHEDESVVPVNENELNNKNLLMELKFQASEKTREAVEFYALEKRVREFLTIENEKPLELEDWMINNKCWCPEVNESVSFAERK